MKKTVQFEIYFDDLTGVAQYYLCKKFKTTIEKENNQRTAPLIDIKREIEVEEEN